MTSLLRFVLTALVAVLFVACATQQHPSADRQESQPEFVLDTAKLLSREQAAEIDAILSTHNRSGFGQTRLVVIPRLPSNTTIEDYSYALLREDLAIPDGRPDLTLLVVSLENRRLRIEVAPAVWPVLSDKFCQQVIDAEIVPQFKQGQFFLGIKAGIVALVAKLQSGNRGQAV